MNCRCLNRSVCHLSRHVIEMAAILKMPVNRETSSWALQALQIKRYVARLWVMAASGAQVVMQHQANALPMAMAPRRDCMTRRYQLRLLCTSIDTRSQRDIHFLYFHRNSVPAWAATFPACARFRLRLICVRTCAQRHSRLSDISLR